MDCVGGGGVLLLLLLMRLQVLQPHGALSHL